MVRGRVATRHVYGNSRMHPLAYYFVTHPFVLHLITAQLSDEVELIRPGRGTKRNDVADGIIVVHARGRLGGASSGCVIDYIELFMTGD